MTSPEPLAALASAYLRARPDEVALDRLADSYTNYVYRASAGDRRVILKHSDNVASWSRCDLPASHIRVEHRFIQAAGEIAGDGIRLPTALGYDAASNTVIMSDLGSEGVALHRARAADLPDAGRLAAVGRFLRRAHGRRWPRSLLALLDAEPRDFGWCTFKLDAWARHEPRWSPVRPFQRPVWPGVTVMDFTPQNCLVFSDALALFDFDFVFMADQLLDLANFQSRMLFMAALGQIPPRRLDAVDALLDGYGDRRHLEGDASAWPAFCEYLAALLHYRFVRDYDEAVALANAPLTRTIFEGRYPTWFDLSRAFLNELKVPERMHA